MYYLFVILIVIYIFLLSNKSRTESFVNTNDPKFTLDYHDSGYDLQYTGKKILNDENVPVYLVVSGLDPNKQKYLQFLGNINDKFKSAMPKTGAFRGSCDDKINEQIQKGILEDVFNKQDIEFGKKQTDKPIVYKKEKSKKNPIKSYDCVGVSNDLCETTNPYFYLSDSSHFPPPWTVSTYKNMDYPKNTNLNCFNKTFDCCKSSLN